MQISDMLSQYGRSIANGTEISGGIQDVRQTGSPLPGLSIGNIFEGTVLRMENGTAALGLPDGKELLAKLDAGVSVRVGESMFFQVYANNGEQVAIRPFAGLPGINPTILHALRAANLQVGTRTAAMVNTMMEQSMPIDRQSLMQMARLVMGNERIDVDTIVRMAKLGIPVTEEMAAQFENYKSDQYAVLDQLETVMEELPKQLSGGTADGEKLLALNRGLLQIFLGEAEAAQDGAILPSDGGVILPSDDGAVLASDGSIKEMGKAQAQPAAEILAKEVLQAADEEGIDSILRAAARDGAKDILIASDTDDASAAQNDVVRNLFRDEDTFASFARQLAKIPELSGSPEIFRNGSLRPDIQQQELLRLFAQAFSAEDGGSHALRELASSKEYRAFLRGIMERQWLLKPEELKTEHKVGELYERLDRQLGQMEQAFKNLGHKMPQLSDAAAQIRSNIQFMNQISQIYAYVQLPLKLSGQNAHSDLFVYTDKKKRIGEGGELTAFLHLDLDHLGSTDVSVKLRKRQVAADFYLTDDASYQLILSNMEILRMRLAQKGYHADIQVKSQEKKTEFVKEMLAGSTGRGQGTLHRYSFDVRA